ncbi:AP-4 complex subunit mu-like isoform X3 [Durio zibethinus]|uniref:AP-4 complex subunit mu-like isoform X3 n=1 Tax=Durio zibethinus TaxID=66656 RepID=A0A6P6AW97_DURZI|nr:AP-4 complex subunit mu-like isoform X3 [Durio zibethinus]
MAMISQLFVLSQRGDNIVFRDYRGEVQKGSAEIFFRKVKFWKDDGDGDAPPAFVGIFNVDGVNYFHVRVSGLLFVATTRVNVSPSLVLELLQRIARVIKDYLGVLNEDSLRKNFVLVYELLDEVIGYILTFEIDGTIQMKSYLTGNPEIRLALNDDLNIGRRGRSIYDYSSSYGSGAVILDDCNFHESVHLDSFDIDRTLTLVPSDGEFSVMSYRMTQEFKPPFRINALLEAAGSLKAEVILKIRADFSPSVTANSILVQMPVPIYTTRVSFELEPGTVGNTTDFKESSKRLEWGLKKIVGGSEHTLRAKLTFAQEPHGNIAKEAGPVSMTFTIPMFNASGLKVKYLQIAKKSNTYNPYRWVRYVTQANSYVARL